MIGMVWGFLKSPLGRWVALAAVGIALLGYGAHRLVVRGREQGAEQAKQEAQQEIESQRQAAKSAAAADVAEADARRAKAERDAAGYQLEAQGFRVRAAALEQQLAGGRARVAALPDGEVHRYNIRALGLRTPEDGTPGYNAAEEREIANRITAAPLLAQQVRQLAAESAKRDQYEAAVAQKVQAILDADQARQAYTTQLEGWYQQLYNLHPPRARKGKCLWLWRCGVDRLAVPSPAEAKAKHP